MKRLVKDFDAMVKAEHYVVKNPLAVVFLLLRYMTTERGVMQNITLFMRNPSRVFQGAKIDIRCIFNEAGAW